MARTALETANTLSSMYDLSFDGDGMEMFSLEWQELRTLAGVAKLTDEYLSAINRVLAKRDYALIPFDNLLVVAMQDDFIHARQLPPRILEQNLLDESEISAFEGEKETTEDEEEEIE